LLKPEQMLTVSVRPTISNFPPKKLFC